MAEPSPRTAIGRLFMGLGLAWVLWSLIVSFGLIDVELSGRFVDLPIIPGILLVVLGRGLARRVPRQIDVPRPVPPSPPKMQRRPPPAPRPPSYQKPAPVPAPRDETLPVMEPDVDKMAEALESMATDMVDAIEGSTVRKSSEEMVAEARRRFGKRP